MVSTDLIRMRSEHIETMQVHMKTQSYRTKSQGMPRDIKDKRHKEEFPSLQRGIETGVGTSHTPDNQQSTLSLNYIPGLHLTS